MKYLQHLPVFKIRCRVQTVQEKSSQTPKFAPDLKKKKGAVTFFPKSKTGIKNKTQERKGHRVQAHSTITAYCLLFNNIYENLSCYISCVRIQLCMCLHVISVPFFFLCLLLGSVFICTHHTLHSFSFLTKTIILILPKANNKFHLSKLYPCVCDNPVAGYFKWAHIHLKLA